MTEPTTKPDCLEVLQKASVHGEIVAASDYGVTVDITQAVREALELIEAQGKEIEALTMEVEVWRQRWRNEPVPAEEQEGK